MAKVIIFNATPYKVNFKGEWEVPPLGNDHAEKKVKGFGNDWIDTILYDLKFSVTTKERPYIFDNHGTVKGVESYAYIVYCKEAEGVCCSTLSCSNRYNLLDAPLEFKKRLLDLTICLPRQIEKSVGEEKRKLEKQLEDAKEAYSKAG